MEQQQQQQPSSGPYPSSNEFIYAILHGNIAKGFPEPPSRLIKVFLSSTRTDFECERQHLHEVVLPKLEQYCQKKSLDLLTIDPHWQLQPAPLSSQCTSTLSTSKQQQRCQNKQDPMICNGTENNGVGENDSIIESNSAPQQRVQPISVTPIIYDQNSNCINPHEFELQLKEIEDCAHLSLATFFMCLVGHKYRPIALPTVIAPEDFQQIFTAAAESGLGDVNLLRSCYKENRNLQPAPQYVLLEPRRASRQYEEELEHIAKLVEYGSKVAAREGLLSNQFGTVMSAVHQQTLHALYCARQWATGNINSPTSRQNFHSTCSVSQQQYHHHHQLQQQSHNLIAPLTPSKIQPHRPPKAITKNCGPSTPSHENVASRRMHDSENTNTTVIASSNQNDLHQLSSPSSTPTKQRNKNMRTNRLIHQVSLQQGPTQKKISMPQRQSSVTTNYALMQQPVDRMLCFIRQFEGVNFNSAVVSRFFDVTPTTMSTSGSGDEQSSASSTTSSSLLVGGTSANNAKQLYAPAAQSDIQQLIEDVILGLKKGNVHYFNISWSPPPDNSLQTRTYTLPEHYIERFGETVLRTLQSSIDEHITLMQNSIFGPLIPGSGFPEYPGDIVREAHSHLSNFRRVMCALGMAQAIDSDFAHLLHIRELLVRKKVEMENSGRNIHSRHQPIIVTGQEGSGKSTLLAQVFTYAPEWLAESSDNQVVRIVRQCGQSPSSNFASELLRSLCIQIAIAYGLDTQLSRSVAAHELSELAICFQELLKLRSNNSSLLIILDDLHHLQSALQSSALLGWMPWNLPTNVHFICSVALESESVLSILRSRVASDNFICLNDFSGTGGAVNIEQNVQQQSQVIFSMVQCKMRDEKRTLTPSQWEFVRQRLKLTQKLDQKTSENFVVNENMTPLFANLLATAVLSNWESFYVPEILPSSVVEIVGAILDDIEECVPCTLVRRICIYLTCTRYGLRETELYNLVQETLVCQVWPNLNQQPPPPPSSLGQQAVNLKATNNDQRESSQMGTPDLYEYPRSTASTWLLLKTKMRFLLKEYYVQGQLYFNWRSPKVAKAVRDRYLIDIRQYRATHQELSIAFNSSFNELNITGRETESIREADELWYHLLCSGNKEKLKSFALLNNRFLSTIIHGVSVCYLKCILDAIRSQILDWDIELLYGMLKQSVHVLIQDSNQLPVEALLWLVPFASPGTLSLPCLMKKSSDHPHQQQIQQHHHRSNLHLSNHGSKNLTTTKTSNHATNTSSYLIEFLRESYRACLEHSSPLLHPINMWLNIPVPPQVAMITIPWSSITRAVTTPDSQHLIACENRMFHFYHLPTKTLTKSVEGHRSTITCLHLASSGKWLATGSEDTTVNIWRINKALMEVNDCKLKQTFLHHTAAVLCVTINNSESLVMSGSEVGVICAVDLHSGTLISRLEHHKSMVTCMGINSGDDVFVSGSTDRTVVIWSLDTFCILNEILLMRPVLHMDISLDSTFLLLCLDDNTLQLRALTTGTGIHTLQPIQTGSSVSSVVTYVRFAEDNCRCVIGYADGRLLLFDIHSAKQIQTLIGHNEMISSILPQKDDHFLITTGGNKIVIWNFYPVKKIDQTGLYDTGIDSRSMYELNQEICLQNSPGMPSDMTSYSDVFSGISTTSGFGGSSSSIGIKDSVSGGGNVGPSSGGGRNSRMSSDRRKQKPTSSSSGGSTGGSFKQKKTPGMLNIENHREAITCVAMSRDGQYLVTGSIDCTIKIWYSSTGETHTTLYESLTPIKCVDIAPNSQFVASGSEDGIIRVWSLTLSMYLCQIVDHQPASVETVKIFADSKRALSADTNSVIRVWQIDNGFQIKIITQKPTAGLHVHGGTCFAIGGKIDNCLKYWPVFEPDNEKSVSHVDSITCFTCTHSSRTIITGSQDMSLKVWEASTGKLTQVLVGHDGAILCVATAALEEKLVVSGAQDCNLIVWDMNTGTELYTLTGHNASVIGVLLTPDGNRALSYSEDNTLQLWDIKETGQRLSMLDVHHNIAHVYSSLTVGIMAVWLDSGSPIIPIIKHHNNCAIAVTVELPQVGTPTLAPATTIEEKSTAWLRGLVPRNASAVLAAKTLKREQSFDSFYFENMLHRGQSVDDFRKIGALTGVSSAALQSNMQASLAASPYGSREQLWIGGHDSTATAPSSTRNRMISKLMNIGPKHKMLKKQQSMFACFPEFTVKGSLGSQVSSGNTPTGSSGLVGGLDLSHAQQTNGLIGKKLNVSTTTAVGQKKLPTNKRSSMNRTGSIDNEASDSDYVFGSEKPTLSPMANVKQSQPTTAMMMMASSNSMTANNSMIANKTPQQSTQLIMEQSFSTATQSANKLAIISTAISDSAICSVM